jgi:hypothetical protein
VSWKKSLKKLFSEEYKLKTQHGNPNWKKALEEAENVLIKKESFVIFEIGVVREL